MPVALIPPFSGRISRMLAQLSKRSSAEHSSAGSSSVEPSAAQLRPKSPPLLLSRLPMFMEHTDSANVLLPAGMPLLAKWQARFYYKDGSLARDLRAIRVRNLVVSFGILLVLGAGIVLVLVASARSERLSRQQMQFVAGVSHEFRTPLAVLRSASDNLADGIVRTPAQTARYGAMMRREINRLWEMVEQTLTFAGIQSGRRSFELQLTQPEDIIERAVQTCGVMLKEAGVTLEQCLNSPLPAILAEPSEMASALTNLISNAVKYSADSSDSPNAHRTPRVRIEARVQATTKIAAKTSVKSIAANSVSMLVFTVQDNGIGISQDDQKHVFEPFYRAKHVVDEQIHGNGLGLAIVKDIVERHGGAIALQSALGKGTTFTIALPLAPAEAALAE